MTYKLFNYYAPYRRARSQIDLILTPCEEGHKFNTVQVEWQGPSNTPLGGWVVSQCFACNDYTTSLPQRPCDFPRCLILFLLKLFKWQSQVGITRWSIKPYDNNDDRFLGYTKAM